MTPELQRLQRLVGRQWLGIAAALCCCAAVVGALGQLPSDRATFNVDPATGHWWVLGPDAVTGVFGVTIHSQDGATATIGLLEDGTAQVRLAQEVFQSDITVRVIREDLSELLFTVEGSLVVALDGEEGLGRIRLFDRVAAERVALLVLEERGAGLLFRDTEGYYQRILE